MLYLAYKYAVIDVYQPCLTYMYLKHMISFLHVYFLIASRSTKWYNVFPGRVCAQLSQGQCMCCTWYRTKLGPALKLMCWLFWLYWLCTLVPSPCLLGTSLTAIHWSAIHSMKHISVGACRALKQTASHIPITPATKFSMLPSLCNTSQESCE